MKEVNIWGLWGQLLFSKKGHDVLQEGYFDDVLLIYFAPSYRLYSYKSSAWCLRLTKPLSKCQRAQWQLLVFDKVYHWQCVASQLFRIYTLAHTHEHTPLVISVHAHTPNHTHAQTHPIQYSSRHKRGKTCRHGRLSKQLQQIETKLNLKPKATPATERPWQIRQGRKGSAAGPIGGGNDGEKGRCGSQSKRELLGVKSKEAEVGQRAGLKQRTSLVTPSKT